MVQLGISQTRHSDAAALQHVPHVLDELFILLLTFVKKPALFVENKDKLLNLGGVDKVL